MITAQKLISGSALLLLFFVIACNNPAKEVTAKQTESKDPLPSWNAGSTKQSIIDFVTKTTDSTNKDFVKPDDRIACFDNDGTLWCEQPFYYQLAFALDEIKRMAPQHPEWKTKQPYKAVLEDDLKTVMAGGDLALAPLAITHANMTMEEFDSKVKNWMANSKHPKTGVRYNQMIYQPMLELMQYLRANGYKTYIVSGGGIDFMRAWALETYDIPPSQVIGTSGKLKYEVRNDTPVLIKTTELKFYNDEAGKPEGIQHTIGKRPVFTAGNSDGDYQMLHYTSHGSRLPSYCMIVHHTDDVREVAYDRTSSIGKLDKALTDAAKYKWAVIDMKKDWNVVFSAVK
jgi:hypothetical protein